MRGEQKDDKVEITIQDTGSGMSKERLAHIWEPSLRMDGENQEYEGTGLGLTIIRDIVAAHKGNISVQSELGVGTTFNLTLNLA